MVNGSELGFLGVFGYLPQLGRLGAQSRLSAAPLLGNKPKDITPVEVSMNTFPFAMVGVTNRPYEPS